MIRNCTALTSLAIASAACGQSINIDFGAQAGAPPAEYGAAGLPGVWNAIDHPWNPDKWPPPEQLGPFGLVDLDGEATGATLMAITTLGTFDIQPSGPTGSDLALMGDGLIGYSPDIAQSVEIEGLASGLYRLITYSWVWPAEMFGMVVFVSGSETSQPVGGAWPGQLTVGVTHMVHVVQVSDGSLTLQIAGAGPGSFFNGNNLIQGLQLWKIDEAPACPADIAPEGGDGSVDIGDLLALISVWGPCPSTPGCLGDLVVDGAVNVNDLLALIGVWGPCPGPNPVTCGEKGLGNCYVAHGEPGCDEPACCTAVCTFDPYCCEAEWDGLCAGIANLAADCANAVHPNCGNPSSGSCFENADSLPGCSDSACCGDVCAMDPYCCNFVWDSVCVDEANATCK
jgi:hypothetical protein